MSTVTALVHPSPALDDRQHHLLSAHGSLAWADQRIIVVDPSLTGPAWLVPAGTKRRGSRNVIALVLPSLNDLTPDLARILCGVRGSTFGIRRWVTAQRRAGHLPTTHTAPVAFGRISA